MDARTARWRLSCPASRGWIARDHSIWRDMLGHERTRPDDGAIADGYPRHDERAGSDKNILPDGDLRHLQRHVRVLEIVCSRAKIRFLGDDGAGSDLDLAQRVGVGAVAQAGTVVEGEIPRDMDASALMDERYAIEFCTEQPQPKKTPAVEWLGGPTAEKRPTEIPQKHAHASLERPRRIIGGCLVKCFHTSSFRAGGTQGFK